MFDDISKTRMNFLLEASKYIFGQFYESDHSTKSRFWREVGLSQSSKKFFFSKNEVTLNWCSWVQFPVGETILNFCSF